MGTGALHKHFRPPTAHLQLIPTVAGQISGGIAFLIYTKAQDPLASMQESHPRIYIHESTTVT